MDYYILIETHSHIFIKKPTFDKNFFNKIKKEGSFLKFCMIDSFRMLKNCMNRTGRNR